MYIKLNRNGYLWMTTLTEILPDGELANGAKAYTARVELSRDGQSIGHGRWDGEGFDGGELGLLTDPGVPDSVIVELEREVRAELAKLGGAA